MAPLHIEHPITSLDTWLDAFNRFADARANAGVTHQRVQQPVDDHGYIVVDLEFADVDAANASTQFLETVVWQSEDLSPGLGGTPTARAQGDVLPA